MNEQQREFLRQCKSIPASKEEKRNLRKISLKTVIIMLVIMAVSVVLGLIKGDLPTILVIGALLCVVAFILEIKDKVKYCTYKSIEVVHVFVENMYMTKGGYIVKVVMFDKDSYHFVNHSVYIDSLDSMKYGVAPGSIVKMLVGVRNSKIYYISMK